MTATVREKGKTLDQGGGIVMTADAWLGPKIAAVAELANFERRYAEKLLGADPQVSAEQMAAALAMYPGLKEAMQKYRAENVNLDGTPILTTVTFDAVKSAEQVAQEKSGEEPESRPSTVGGLIGGFGRKAARKKSEEGASASNRATVMTMTQEVLSVSTSVAPTDVDLPPGFTKK